MPLYRVNGRTILFIHIPKTGGTTIESWLREQGSEALFLPQTPHWLACTAQHLHAAILRELVPPGYVDYAFTVVRHPTARFVSEFFHQLAPMCAAPRRFAWQQPILSAGPQKLARYFDRWASRTMGRYLADMYAHDNHIRPQTHFLDYDGLEVFRFEQGIASILRSVASVLDIPAPEGLTARKVSQRADFTMSERVEGKIRAFYSEDYRRLGYAAEACRGSPGVSGEVSLVAGAGR